MSKSLPQASELPAVSNTEHWCYNHLEVIKYSYTFVIDNFSLRKEKTGDPIVSSIFTAGRNGKLKWCLHVYPRGKTKDDQNYLSLYLNLVSCEVPEVEAKFKFLILNKYRMPTKVLVSDIQSFLECRSWGFNKFICRDILLDKANCLLPEDKLLIRAEFNVVAEGTNVRGQISSSSVEVPESLLSEELGELLQKRQFSDVIISVNGRELHAHKAILTARSPVFAAMFSHDMKENILNSVEITDIDYEVLKEMLGFIYTGKAPNLESMACELLEASNKYDLRRLKLMCEEALGKRLTKGNVCDMLMLADRHDAKQLKNLVMDFMVFYATDAMDTSGWKAVVMRQAHLAADTFKEVTARLVRRHQPSS